MKFDKTYKKMMEDATISAKEMECPKCKSDDTVTLRKKPSEGAGGMRKVKLHKCKKCNSVFNDDGKILPKHN